MNLELRKKGDSHPHGKEKKKSRFLRRRKKGGDEALSRKKGELACSTEGKDALRKREKGKEYVNNFPCAGGDSKKKKRKWDSLFRGRQRSLSTPGEEGKKKKERRALASARNDGGGAWGKEGKNSSLSTTKRERGPLRTDHCGKKKRGLSLPVVLKREKKIGNSRPCVSEERI